MFSKWIKRNETRTKVVDSSQINTNISMAGCVKQSYGLSGSSKIVKSETRTITKGGVTETITTEVVESYVNGVPTRTTRTTKTTNTSGQHNSGHFGSGSSPDISNKITILDTKMGNLHIKSKEKHGSKLNDSNKSKVSKTKTKHDSSSSDSDSDADDFEKECLKQHNSYRSSHGVPKLKLSKSMCQFAKEWATKCANEDSMRHRPNNKYGENIFMKWSSSPSHKISGKDAVESWYSEIKVHQFGTEPRSLNSGHFSQVVWKSSKELGVAQARSKNGNIYVVANYNPPGNMLGNYADNVPPPK